MERLTHVLGPPADPEANVLEVTGRDIVVGVPAAAAITGGGEFAKACRPSWDMAAMECGSAPPMENGVWVAWRCAACAMRARCAGSSI